MIGGGVARGHLARPGESLAEVLPLEELHRDVRRPLKDSVVDDLDHVRAPDLRGRLGLPLEAGQRDDVARELPLDELDGARDVEAYVRGLPHRPHRRRAR